MRGGYRALPALALALLVAGCSPQGEAPEPAYRALVDDCAVVVAQKERELLRCEQMLDTATACLAGERSVQEADRELEELYSQTMAEYIALERCELSAEQRQALTDHGIEPADYAAIADERIDDLYAAGRDIYAMRSYILWEDRDALEHMLELEREICALEAEYNAWAINYLFCGWEGEALAYARAQTVEKLSAGHRLPVWLTDRDEVERRTADCLDRWGECCQRLRLYVEQKELELDRAMEAAGRAAPERRWGMERKGGA